MKKINKIFTVDFCYELDDSQSIFLFDRFYLFILKREINLENIYELELSNEEVVTLKLELETCLTELLNAGYKSPTEVQIQKYSTRYEKIVVNKEQYILDYRMSFFGRLAFFIKCVIDSLNKTFISKCKVVILLNDLE